MPSPEAVKVWWDVFERVTCSAITKKGAVCRQLAAYREKESGHLLCPQHAQVRFQSAREEVLTA